MMKGLLLKDYYTLLKQMKIFLLMIIVFSMLPNLSLASFAIIYAAMLPITVLGYDERAKWDSLAVMMPYSTRNIVLSKYVLGYIAIAGAAVISMGAQLVIGAVQHNTAPAGETLLVVGVASGLALLFIALNLPLMFRLGVEKGRVAFFITFAVGVFLAFTVAEQTGTTLYTAAPNTGIIIAAVAVAVIALNALSIRLAMRWYKRRVA